MALLDQMRIEVLRKERDSALAEIKRLRAALAEARQWLISVDRELLSHGSTTLKPTIAKIDTLLGRVDEQETNNA